MTNLLVAIATFFVFILFTLVAAKLGKTYLFALSITFILLTNITVQMTVEILPRMSISWAIVLYSLVYLITDLVIELYGRSEAYKLAASNLAAQIMLWIYIWLSLKATPSSVAPSAMVYDTMNTLFGTTTRISIAAIAASLGPFADIFTTVPIRNYLSKRKLFSSASLNLLARAKLSTLLGEFINTVIFFTLVLFGTGVDYRTLTSIILSATAVKWTISAADSPFLWAYFRFVGLPREGGLLRPEEAK